MLLEIAVGDAYGAGMEYVPDEFVREHNHLGGYVQHPRHRIAPGSYTDDTQLSIAIAEAVLDDREWTRESLAARFVGAFKRDPREGYASRFHDFLVQIEGPEEFLRDIDPSSDKSGAAMRAVPIGVYPDVAEVLERCTLQARLTHDTPAGIAAACAASLAGHYFLHDVGPRAGLGAFLEAHVPGEWAVPWAGRVGAQGWMSVRAAITAITRHDTLSSILRQCVAFGGDVDTVAAVALGAAAASREVAHDLPDVLLSGLEDGPYGRRYLHELDVRLSHL